MSGANSPDQSTSTEVLTLRNLTNLGSTPAGQALTKTGTSTFSNVSVSGSAWNGGIFAGNNSQTVFVLPTPATSFYSVFLNLNGQELMDKNILGGTKYDYTLSADLKTITMVNAPLSSDNFIYKYQ